MIEAGGDDGFLEAQLSELFEEFVVGRDWYFSGSLLALLVLRLVPFG
jgi:hypothetical protein